MITNDKLDQLIADMDNEKQSDIVGLLEELQDRRNREQAMRMLVKSRAIALLDTLDRLGDDARLDDLFF